MAELSSGAATAGAGVPTGHRVRFIVTGFGKFNGVPENPTSVVLPQLKEAVTDAECVLSSVVVLETSASGSLEQLQTLRREHADAGPHICTVWLHFGVNAGSQCFALERQAFNNASFRVPDERGAAPMGDTIIKSDALDLVRNTKLPVADIVDSLVVAGHNVQESMDPGRFVCNYVYYSSLSYTSVREHEMALFCHVPSFDTIPEADHLRFAVDLVSTIGTLMRGTALEASAGIPRQMPPLLLPEDLLSSLGLLLGMQAHSGEVSVKMVVLVNMELRMKSGKIASQACHAALKVQRRLMKTAPQLLEQWRMDGEPIVVLKCPTSAELESIGAEADKLCIPTGAIRDAGRTQVTPGSKTVLAVGPALSPVFRPLTGHLKLL